MDCTGFENTFLFFFLFFNKIMHKFNKRRNCICLINVGQFNGKWGQEMGVHFQMMSALITSMFCAFCQRKVKHCITLFSQCVWSISQQLHAYLRPTIFKEGVYQGPQWMLLYIVYSIFKGGIYIRVENEHQFMWFLSIFDFHIPHNHAYKYRIVP